LNIRYNHSVSIFNLKIGREYYDWKLLFIKPRMTKTDIYYKVYVTNTFIYFIKIGGQFHNRYAYEKQLPDILEHLFLFWFKKMEKKQGILETDIDEKISSGDVDELIQRKHNFSLTTNTIEEILIKKQGTFHTGFHDNGTISFTLKNGEKIKFIIPKATLLSSIKDNIRQFHQTLSIREGF